MATIKDVARLSGVSTTTVSFVLNGTGSVGAEARERVLQAARELGYSPDPLARAMITRRTRSLGILVNTVSSPITSSMLSGIEEAARALGYEIMLSLHRDDPATAIDAVRSLTARRVDAIIAVFARAEEHPELVAALPKTGLPYAIAFYPAPGTLAAEIDNMVADQEQGGELATSHLFARGCRRLAFAGGPIERNATRLRLRGFQRACAALQLPVSPEHIQYARLDFRVEEGFALGQQLLAAEPAIDGIFAANDDIAAGLLQYLRRVGRRVPDDVAVIGFNDGDFCAAVDPPLTSVRMPLEEIGRLCVERALLRLERPEAWKPETFSLPCTLTLRESA